MKTLSNYQGSLKVGNVYLYAPNFFKKIVMMAQWSEKFCLLTNMGIQILDYQPKVNVFSENTYYSLINAKI